MKRKFLAAILSTALVVSLFTGCGEKKEAESETDFSGETLNIITWEGDVSDTVIKDFEKKYDCKVNVTYMEDTNTLLNKMLLGDCEYDLVDIESAYIKTFVDAEVLAPLNYDIMKNVDNIDEIYREKGAVGDEEFKYTLPLSGPLFTGIVYNKETCPIEIKDFNDLADPALKGELWSTNATISLYAGALVALGYDANSGDEKELNEAQELLQKIKKNVKVFGASSISSMETGECSVAYTYDYNMLMNDDEANWDKFGFVPTGSLGYNQLWGVAAESEHQNMAAAFIDFTLLPEESAKLHEEWGGVPLLKEELIKDLLPENYYDNPYIAEFNEMWPTHEDLSINDDQISVTDTLYTELMADQ